MTKGTTESLEGLAVLLVPLDGGLDDLRQKPQRTRALSKLVLEGRDCATLSPSGFPNVPNRPDTGSGPTHMWLGAMPVFQAAVDASRTHYVDFWTRLRFLHRHVPLMSV